MPKFTSWQGVAKVLQEDIKADPLLSRSAWPCMKRFLLGGPVCASGCKSCGKNEGKGDDAPRERARAKFASLAASGAFSVELHADLRKGERSRA